MIASLQPAGVQTRESFGDQGPHADVALFPAEQAAVAGVSAERRQEFTTVRGCARAALAELGMAAVPLVPSTMGAPRWPAGVVGSMTHCAGYRAAAVARTCEFAALGIDAEPREPLPHTVAAHLVHDAESAWLHKVFADGRPPADRLLFSAKEAAYKAFSPWLGSRIGVRDLTVLLNPGGTFQVVLPRGGASVPLAVTRNALGHWTTSRDFVFTSMSVPSHVTNHQIGR